MKLMLDTHALLWALGEPDRLTRAVQALLEDPDHAVVASAVSGWEIAIKQSLGKLELPAPAESWLPPALKSTGIGWLAVTPEHALAVRQLPWHHRDPFDRLLVAQALADDWTLVTHDRALAPYGMSVVWI